MFETQLAVSGMYHVICFCNSDSKYTQHLLFSSQDHVLSVTAQTNGYVHILTVSRLVTCLGTWEGTCRGAEITSQVDVSDIWRVEPLERAMFSIYTSGCFVVLESSAIHFIKLKLITAIHTRHSNFLLFSGITGVTLSYLLHP